MQHSEGVRVKGPLWYLGAEGSTVVPWYRRVHCGTLVLRVHCGTLVLKGPLWYLGTEGSTVAPWY